MRSIFLQPYRCRSRRRTDAGIHTPCRLCSETLLDDFLAKYVLWLWVPASRFACAGRRPVDLSCRHCERSEAIHGTSATKLDCFAALAMTGVATAGKHTQLSFPDVQIAHRGCAAWRRPGIHNHEWGLWIPGSMLRIARNDGLVVLLWR